MHVKRERNECVQKGNGTSACTYARILERVQKGNGTSACIARNISVQLPTRTQDFENTRDELQNARVPGTRMLEV